MSKRIGRWRGEVDEPTGLKALGTIGSAPATFMMSRATSQAPIQDEYTVAAVIRFDACIEIKKRARRKVSPIT